MIIKNPKCFRENIVEKIIKPIFTNTNNIDIIVYSKDLEKGVYNWTVNESRSKKVLKKWSNPYFVRIYKDRLRTVCYNLKQNKSIALQVKNGEI